LRTVYRGNRRFPFRSISSDNIFNTQFHSGVINIVPEIGNRIAVLQKRGVGLGDQGVAELNRRCGDDNEKQKEISSGLMVPEQADKI
jgi:hypothetical protein